MRSRCWVLIWFVLIAGTAARAQLPSSGFEVGQPFPDLVLPSAEDGRPMSLADFRGQKLILHIFASW